MIEDLAFPTIRLSRKDLPEKPSKPPKAPFEGFEGDQGKVFFDFNCPSGGSWLGGRSRVQ
jgi:hypothetical protein